MINLYNNHENKNLKFKMDITGVESNEIKPRLVIESGDSIFMVKGEIDGTDCRFEVPVLETFEQGGIGSVCYEVIIQDEQYQKLWEENFEVISKVEVKVLESNIQEEKPKAKPQVSITSVVEMEEKPEKPKKEVEDKINEIVEESSLDNLVGKKKPKKKSTKKVKIEEKKDSELIYNDNNEEDDNSDVFSFDKFINRKNEIRKDYID